MSTSTTGARITTDIPARMIAAGLVEVAIGVKAEGRSLEDIATPLSVDAGTREGDARS